MREAALASQGKSAMEIDLTLIGKRSIEEVIARRQGLTTRAAPRRSIIEKRN